MGNDARVRAATRRIVSASLCMSPSPPPTTLPAQPQSHRSAASPCIALLAEAPCSQCMQRAAVMHTTGPTLEQGRLELTCTDVDDSVALPAPLHYAPAHQSDRRLRQPPPCCHTQHLQAAHAQQLAQAALDVSGTVASSHFIPCFSSLAFCLYAYTRYVLSACQPPKLLICTSGSKPRCCKGVLAAS